ncbi:MAG: 50S ribosomal protein L25 [Candidatus Binatia bacterium]
METIVLTVESRQGTGKEKSGRLRRSGKVPAVFYGSGKAALSLVVDAREFNLKLGNLAGSHLIQLQSLSSETDKRLALLKEVQRHPVTSHAVHIDFYEVDENKPVTVTVPLHFVGKAQGVTAGGTLQSLRREISVECLPREIPEFFEIDVSSVGIHDFIRVGEIALPTGVTALDDPEEAVVTVVPEMAAQPEAPTEEGAAAETPTAQETKEENE